MKIFPQMLATFSGLFVIRNMKADDLQGLVQEMQFKTSRSGGKGGQHVNKTESKVELIFSIPNSLLLSEEQKELLLLRWKNRIDEEGNAHFTEESDRSQFRNKELIIKKFFKLLHTAFRPVKPRKQTKVPRAVIQKRKDDKRKRSEIKALRKSPGRE